MIRFVFAVSIWLAISSAVGTSAHERVALVIGNGDYRHVPRLNNPPNDAADVAKALKGLGFEVVGGVDLDKRALEDKIIEFSRKLDHAKIALFFYAGHGLQVDGRNYLAPIDAKIERAGELSLATIDINLVLAQMEGGERISLVFLDACRDNPLARSLARAMGSARSASVGRGLATIQSAVGTMIAFATQPEAVAFDGVGTRNSPFTTALLKHIATPGLEVRSMMTRVRADVIAATNKKQVPWDHSSLTSEVVLTAAPASARPSQNIAPTPPDEITWGFIKDSADIGTLRRFVAQYPTSIHMVDAQGRIAALVADAQNRIAALGLPQDMPASTPSAPPVKEALAAAPVPPPKPPLSEKEISPFRDSLMRAWDLPSVTQLRNGEPIIVTVDVKISPDGTVESTEVKTRGAGQPFERMKDSVLRAINKAQPFTMLQDADHSSWKNVEITFDPRMKN